jgi:hypothetical protein
VVDFSRRFEIATPEAPLRAWFESVKGKQVKSLPKKVGVVVEEVYGRSSCICIGFSENMLAPLRLYNLLFTICHIKNRQGVQQLKK